MLRDHGYSASPSHCVLLHAAVPCGPRAILPYPFTSPLSHLLLYLLVSDTFPFCHVFPPIVTKIQTVLKLTSFDFVLGGQQNRKQN